MSERLIRCDICQRILPENTLISEDTFNLCKDTKACDDWMDNNLADFEVTLQGFVAERQKNEELQAENTQLKAELNEAQGKLQEWGGVDNYLLSTDLDKANEANAQLKAEVAELREALEASRDCEGCTGYCAECKVCHTREQALAKTERSEDE